MTQRDDVKSHHEEVKAMSKYTTGEMAKLCGITVRTVQYYDTRNILVPSQLSEGGRRLYSEEDLKRLKIICFLRDMDLPINSIAQLLAEEHPENVIDLLLEQQEKALRSEISQRQARLSKLEQLQRELKTVEHFSVESIGDIAYMMENKKMLRKVHMTILAVGISLDIAEIAAVAVWILKGIWRPFALWLAVDLLIGVWIMRYYYKKVDYICPGCHRVFRPTFREMVFARHTPNTRKLTCTRCSHHGFCVEVYGEEKQ